MAQVNVHEVKAEEFILALAEHLKKKKEFEAPEWTVYVKTGVSKARPPESDDWWYVRAAAILRTLYTRGITGTKRLRIKYGSRKKRGVRPEKFGKASGKIIRIILQQAEAAKLVEKVEKGQHGRRLTVKGREFLDSIKTQPK